jgi:hypothetical protein
LPSTSPGRGVRVVVDKDNFNPASSFSNALTREDFPAPEGATIINMLP